MDNKELTQEERIETLEKQVELLCQHCEEIRKFQTKIVKGLNTLIDSNKKNIKEWEEWSSSTETRLGKLIVQQLNMGIIMEVLLPMDKITKEQQEQINAKVEKLKNQAPQYTKDNDLQQSPPPYKP